MAKVLILSIYMSFWKICDTGKLGQVFVGFKFFWDFILLICIFDFCNFTDPVLVSKILWGVVFCILSQSQPLAF